MKIDLSYYWKPIKRWKLFECLWKGAHGLSIATCHGTTKLQQCLLTPLASYLAPHNLTLSRTAVREQPLINFGLKKELR